MYRTGDLVRWTHRTASLEYLGRTDFQVKSAASASNSARSSRAARAMPRSRQAAVIARARPRAGRPRWSPTWCPRDRRRASTPAGLRGRRCRAAAARAHGAVRVRRARRAAAHPAASSTARRCPRRSSTAPAFRAPRTPDRGDRGRRLRRGARRRAGRRRRRLLRPRRQLAVATRVVARLGATLGRAASLRRCSRRRPWPRWPPCSSPRSGRRRGPPLVRRRTARDRVPLSLAQQRMWFLNRSTPTRPPTTSRRGPPDRRDLDVDALHAARRRRRRPARGAAHRATRTVDGSPSAGDPAADAADDRRSNRDRDRRGRPATAAIARWPLPPVRRHQPRPPVRAATCSQLGADEHVLSSCVHHIAADGWSMARWPAT